MIIRLVPIIALVMLLLGGCSESATETSKDVGQAREKARDDVSAAQKDAVKDEDKAEHKVAEAQQDYAETRADAQGNLNQVEADAMVTRANADYDVALAEMEGQHRIAIEKCDALKDVEKDSCVSTADATFEADKARAIANRDAILVQAEDQQ
ncbi:MAG: hypothetical protein SH820_08095 [Xanthomonadales bacterium]|nr:hypothetical protein [Xanthomonadales bacterium]